MVKDQYPDAVNEATTGILPVWLEAFKTLLNIDVQQELNGGETWDGLLVRTQIFKVCHFHGTILVFEIDLLVFRLWTSFASPSLPPSRHTSLISSLRLSIICKLYTPRLRTTISQLQSLFLEAQRMKLWSCHSLFARF